MDKGNGKYSAKDIANFFIYLMSDSTDDLTNMKINKLLYYAQGHYFKKFGVPLFADDLEAWPHGPVVKDVYNAYKRFSDMPVNEYNEQNVNKISEDDKTFLIGIARKYGRYTASALRNMTHTPGSPWSQTPGGVIPIQLIKKYFDSREEDIKPLEIEFEPEDIIERRDSSGVILLPKEWRDE